MALKSSPVAPATASGFVCQLYTERFVVLAEECLSAVILVGWPEEPARYRRERGFDGGLALFGLIRQVEDSPLISWALCAPQPDNNLHQFGAVCAHVSPRRVPGP